MYLEIELILIYCKNFIT